jgi:A/G-specific adenine glycosylase
MGKRRHSDSEDYDDEDYATSKRTAKTSKIRPKTAPKKKTKTNECFPIESESQQSQILVTSPPHDSSLHIINASTSSTMQSSLLEWFDKVRDSRGMPWRKPFDASLNSEQRTQRAYEVWVSEIMLQQTQVATVIPYYNAWMTK